jgi:hypothetical protein
MDFDAPGQFERQHVRPRAGRALIVGSYVTTGKVDRRTLYPDSLGVDMRPGIGVDRVLNLEHPLPADLGTFAHVECISVIEHTPRPWLMAANIEQLLEPGGTLHVGVPFMWRVHAYPGDFWRCTVDGIRALFPGIDWTVLRYGNVKLHEGSKVPTVKVMDHPYFARTEAYGFGVRKAA